MRSSPLDAHNAAFPSMCVCHGALCWPRASGSGRKACRPDFLNRGGEGGSVDVAVDPEELERLGAAGREQLYNAAAGVAGKEDYSDLVATNAAAKKRKLQEKAAAQANKKAKDSFKF